MNEKFQIPMSLAKNPLDIIALFTSLIYGMSALLLGTSVGSLAIANQTILVIFIVIFPFVVLGVFAWFVAKHHKKLYGPGDFRSDEAFHAADNLSPADLGRRLTKENEAAGAEREKPSSETTPTSGETARPSDPQGGTAEPSPAQNVVHLTDRQFMIARAYLAEGLVFQELQRELGGAVRREVALPFRGGRRLRLMAFFRLGTTPS